MVPPEEVRQRYADTLDSSQIAALDLLFGIRACVQGIDTVVARWLGPDALTPGRFQILVTLWCAAGPLPQHEIVKRLDVTRATISGLIAALERDGLVTATIDASDKRKMLVALTAAGSELIDRLVRETTNSLRRAFAGFTDDELRTLAVQLGRLTRGVGSALKVA